MIVSTIIKDILESGAIVVIDPIEFEVNPDDFLEHYGHLIDRIALVAKGKNGYAYYPSNSAPKDKNLGVFFHSFCTIANNMGIKVDSILYSHGDNFLSQNSDFKVVTTEGVTVPLYACPSQEYISQYLASISFEVTNYPIESLILDDIMFPSKKSCFCDRCRRNFASKVNIERDFSFNYLENKDLLLKWFNYRVNLINQTLREVSDSVKRVKNIDISAVIKADVETGTIAGSSECFAQSIVEMSKISNNVLIHVNPWTDIPTDINSANYQKLLSSLNVLSDYANSGVKYSLYFWNINSLDKLNVVQKLGEELRGEHLYIDPFIPPDFTKRRTINLGY